MISKPLADAKKVDLEAELELYREGGIEDVVGFNFASKNSDRVAEIERLRALHGHPVKLDEAFLAENPELVAVAEASGDKLEADGSVVFFSEADLASAEEQKKPDMFVVTQEHLDTNEVFAKIAEKNGIKVGDEVPYDPAVVISREAAIAAGINVEEVEKGIKKGGKASAESAPAGEDDAPVAELVYQRKTVIRVENVIAGGTSYKDVYASDGCTYRLTLDEFNRDVAPRE